MEGNVCVLIFKLDVSFFLQLWLLGDFCPIICASDYKITILIKKYLSGGPERKGEFKLWSLIEGI